MVVGLESHHGPGSGCRHVWRILKGCCEEFQGAYKSCKTVGKFGRDSGILLYLYSLWNRLATFLLAMYVQWHLSHPSLGRLGVFFPLAWAVSMLRFHHCTEHRFWLELPPFKHTTLAEAFQISDDFCRSVPTILSQSKSICIMYSQISNIYIYIFS